MSQETREWLSTMTRIGDTDRRGEAWHYRQGDQNHFPGAVPTEEVRRLFMPWEPIETPDYITVPATAAEYATQEDNRQVNGIILRDGDKYVRLVQLKQYKAIIAQGHPEHAYSVPSGAYAIHSYNEWLVKNVENLLDGEVHISSAGLLDKAAVAWVELSLSETHTVADFPFRPHLLAFTSVNSKYKTSYGRKVQAVVCDNTLHVASQEKGQDISYKHTKGSTPRIADARAALGLIVATADDFSRELEDLLDWKVSSREFSRFLDEYVPTVNDDGTPLEKGALTQAENKREKMATMWRSDERVSPWAGTAFGVVQLSNTYFHHERRIRSSTVRPERNMLSAISGETATNDMATLNLLTKVASRV